MKSYFFKSIILVFVLFVSPATFSQDNFQGKAYYQSKTTVDMSNWGGGQMSEERKKQIAERMKSMFEKTYILTFNKSESVYKEEEKLDAPGGGRGGFRMMGIGGGVHYKNVKNQQLLQEQEFFGKQFLVKDSLAKLSWVMGGETKQIGNYTAFKATATKKVDELDFANMRRRNRDNEEKKDEAKIDSTKTVKVTEEIEIPKEITVTAWYTPQIPINQGPGEFWGLPGLILEVQSGRTTILCTKIIMNPEEKKEIKAPSKGKQVTQKEYNETIKKKMEEMREMYGGRNRGGRRIRIN